MPSNKRSPQSKKPAHYTWRAAPIATRTQCSQNKQTDTEIKYFKRSERKKRAKKKKSQSANIFFLRKEKWYRKRSQKQKRASWGGRMLPKPPAWVEGCWTAGHIPLVQLLPPIARPRRSVLTGPSQQQPRRLSTRTAQTLGLPGPHTLLR